LLRTYAHHADGGGDAEHVFALLALLGFQFAPRIPDLKSRRLCSFAKASAYPTLAPLIAGRINVALIRTHWAEILRVARLELAFSRFGIMFFSDPVAAFENVRRDEAGRAIGAGSFPRSKRDVVAERPT
jgi:hypothetical protein